MRKKTHIYSKCSIQASKVGFAKVLNVGFWELLNIGSLPGILEFVGLKRIRTVSVGTFFSKSWIRPQIWILVMYFFFASPSLKIVHFEHFSSKLWTRSQTNEVWWGVSSSSLSFTWKCYKMLILNFFSKNPACNKLEHWNVNIPCSTCKKTMQGTYASNFSSNYLYISWIYRCRYRNLFSGESFDEIACATAFFYMHCRYLRCIEACIFWLYSFTCQFPAIIDRSCYLKQLEDASYLYLYLYTTIPVKFQWRILS